MTLEWAGPGETVTWVHAVVAVQGIGFVGVDPVAVPVETCWCGLKSP